MKPPPNHRTHTQIQPHGSYIPCQRGKNRKVNIPSSYVSVSVSYLRFLFAINHKINCLSVSCILGLDKRGAHENENGNENENATKAWKCGLPQLAACDRSLLVFGPAKRVGKGGGNGRALDAACDTYFFPSIFSFFVPPQEVWVVRGSPIPSSPPPPLTISCKCGLINLLHVSPARSWNNDNTHAHSASSKKKEEKHRKKANTTAKSAPN